MVKVLVLADDLTGALDTSVQFAGSGTLVIPYREYDFINHIHAETEVLVLHLNTRHCTAQEAFGVTRDIANIAVRNGIEIVYKKTDSALRGNVGAELDGVMTGGGFGQLYFVPAFPHLNRITVHGIQYIDEKPLAQSIFRQDPIDPTHESSVLNIIRAQTDRPVTLIEELMPPSQGDDRDGIIVFDAADDGRMLDIAKWLGQKQGPLAIAGCAGFVRELSHIVDIQRSTQRYELAAKGMLIVSGSVNPMNLRQIACARKHGFEMFSAFQLTGFMSDEEFEPRGNEIDALLKRYERSGRLIIMTSELVREVPVPEDGLNVWAMESQKVADNLAKIVVAMLKKGLDGLVAVSGGDTLGSVITGMGAQGVEPLDEIETGVVLSRITVQDKKLYIATKSGAFGSEDVYMNIFRRCCGTAGGSQSK